LQNFSSLTKDLPPHLLEPLSPVLDILGSLDHQEEVQRFIQENKSSKPSAFEPYKFEQCAEVCVEGRKEREMGREEREREEEERGRET
jgi:hypothetical protein